MAYNDAQQQEHQKINTFHIYAWFPQLIVSGITFPLNSKAKFYSEIMLHLKLSSVNPFHWFLFCSTNLQMAQ